MTQAYINQVVTAVPPNDVHGIFLEFGRTLLRGDNRRLAVFNRMADRAGIEHRFSVLAPADDRDGDALDGDGLYRLGRFPDTATRMRLFEQAAPRLAAETVERLLAREERSRISHLIVTSCTGLSAPGIDLELVARCRLRPDIERSFVGFMGCYAAINALKLARHIVRSQPEAHVLTVNLELCTLHLHETDRLEEMLSFLLWGDGCAAALISAEPRGAAMESFHAALLPGTQELMRWHIREQGFDMVLSGAVPAAIQAALSASGNDILRGRTPDEIALWAVHPGGRTVLDAVEQAFGLKTDELAASRSVLRDFGNMSSGTVMFVLERLMRQAPAGAPGCAMAFGPGLVAETMQFRMAA